MADAAKRLQPALRGRRVLLVGAVAERAPLKTLVRLAGARVMAATDLGIAYSLLVKFPIDIIIGEPNLQMAGGDAFESAVRRVASSSADALWVELPPRTEITDEVAFPQLRLAHSRPGTRRGTTPTARPHRRALVRRAG